MLTLEQALRLALYGRTQKEVARLIGASDRSIRRWKAGTHKPTFRHLDRLQELAETVRKKRIKAGAPKLPVPPPKIRGKITRLVDIGEEGEPIFVPKKIGTTAYDMRGANRAEIVEVLKALRDKGMDFRFIVQMPKEGNYKKTGTGSSEWYPDTKNFSDAVLDRLALRALQLGPVTQIMFSPFGSKH